MTITSAICNSFKVEILQGGHNFNDSSGAPTGNTFKIKGPNILQLNANLKDLHYSPSIDFCGCTINIKLNWIFKSKLLIMVPCIS